MLVLASLAGKSPRLFTDVLREWECESHYERNERVIRPCLYVKQCQANLSHMSSELVGNESKVTLGVGAQKLKRWVLSLARHRQRGAVRSVINSVSCTKDEFGCI